MYCVLRIGPAAKGGPGGGSGNERFYWRPVRFTVLDSISRDPPAQRSVPGHSPPPPSSTASAETLQLRGQSQVTALLHRPPQHQPRPSSSEVSPRSQPSSTVLHSISRDPPAQRSVPGHSPPPPSSTASAETLQLRGQSQVTALLHRPPQHQPRPSSSEVSPRSHPSSTVLDSISRDPLAQRSVPGHSPPPPSSTASAETLQLRGQSQVTSLLHRPPQYQPRPSSSEVSPRSQPSSTVLHSISRDPPAQRSVPGHSPPPPSSTASAETLQLRGQSQVTSLLHRPPQHQPRPSSSEVSPRSHPSSTVLHSISRDPPAQRSVPGHIPPPPSSTASAETL